ncbi:MAG: threonylcarbamoyl-AMP synthase [Alphaproteobacteria bacterium]|nr:threonylcarbamoyl-AMP synthase [Alphaproteobacteria bacterium]
MSLHCPPRPGRQGPVNAPESRIQPATTAALKFAGKRLREGALVAFPTETVYGLGGDATNGQAIARIFAIKSRPSFNPLIVHLYDLAAAEKVAGFDDRARALARRFWPGPLTFVLKRRADTKVSELASAGLDTVAVRAPANDVARTLLKAAGRPIAAPSANRSGHVSPTAAEHVAASLGTAVDLILDGGTCTIGIESTVLDLSGERAVLLRPGAVTAEMLNREIGAIDLADASDEKRPRSPGMMDRHYAPSIPVRLDATAVEPGDALLSFGAHAIAGFAAERNLSEKGDLTEAAANLYRYLRELDWSGFRTIAVMPIPEEGLGLAINDRLRRAAAVTEGAAAIRPKPKRRRRKQEAKTG